MAGNFLIWNEKKYTFTGIFYNFLSFIGGTDAFWLFGYLLQIWVNWMVQGDGIHLSPQYIHLSASPWECPATLPAAPSLCVLCCCYKKMLDCSSVGAPGLRGTQAGREHRQRKCRQEAKWPCGLTGAARGCPAKSEWQQCPWLATGTRALHPKGILSATLTVCLQKSWGKAILFHTGLCWVEVFFCISAHPEHAASSWMWQRVAGCFLEGGLQLSISSENSLLQTHQTHSSALCPGITKTKQSLKMYRIISWALVQCA